MSSTRSRTSIRRDVDGAESVDEILARLEAQASALGRREAAELLDMPPYAAVDRTTTAGRNLAEEVAAYTERHVRLFVATARRGRPPAGPELNFVRERGALRARALFPLELILKVHHLGQRLHWEAITDAAAPTPAGMHAALSLTFFTFEYAIAVNGAVAEGYLQERYVGLVDAERVRRDLLEALLNPNGTTADVIGNRAASLGLQFGAEHVLITAVASTSDGVSSAETLRRAADALGRRAQPRAEVPFTVIRHDEVVAIVPLGRRDPRGVAGALHAAVEETARRYAIHVVAGVSAPLRNPDDVPRAYAQARRALVHARSREAPVALEEVGVFAELASSAGPVARGMITEQVRQMLDHDGDRGGVLLDTLRAYAAADLNVSRAAEALGVHANTMHYRLGRVLELSGRDPRRFADLVDLLAAVELLAGEAASSPPRPLDR